MNIPINNTNIIDIYISYLQCIIFIDQIKIIQKYTRMNLFMKNIRKYIHKHKTKNLMNDIIELSYLPPQNDCILLKNGGFNYRIHEQSFYMTYNLLLN